jgi:peptidoglycan-associated lipoprotein
VPIFHVEERIISFGQVKRGEKRSHTFEFSNLGSVDLLIDIISSCDCTTVTYEKGPYKPGQKGQIHIVFDSTEKEESESTDIDILLENTVPSTGAPIIETLRYTFELIP